MTLVARLTLVGGILPLLRFVAGPRSRRFALAAMLPLALVVILATAHPAAAASVQSADLSDVIGTNGFFSFSTLLRMLQTTVAQVIAALCIVGGVWELRQNKELGSIGHMLCWTLLAVGMLAAMPSIWSAAQRATGITF